MPIANWQEQMRRGLLELAVLLAIAPEPRYGLEILKQLAGTDLVLTEGTIYPLAGAARAGSAGAGALGRR